MKQHNILVSKPSSSSKGIPLSTDASCAFSNSYIFDSGASHHITYSCELFPYPSYCNISQITVGYSSQIDVRGLGTVQLDDGCINNVFLVLHISTNFLSIYQICHTGNWKTVEFSPNDVVIRELHNPETIVAFGQVDHGSCLYRFVGFESSSGSSFISHVDSLSRLWHEIFGDLNYRYLQQMS